MAIGSMIAIRGKNEFMRLVEFILIEVFSVIELSSLREVRVAIRRFVPQKLLRANAPFFWELFHGLPHPI